jgi:hypothetical protein
LRLLAIALAALASMAQTPAPDALTRARQLYNAGKFSEAAAAAAEARQVPALANAAAVVYARARLEKYRETPDPKDLEDARAALREVDPSKLAPRDDIEYVIGLGVAVYLEGDAEKQSDRFGAAADSFDAALVRAGIVDEPARDRIFNWWATALDRQAQLRSDTDRKATWQRIVQRADLERARSDGAISAMYWQVKASAGAGDLERAWSGAVSTWIRAGKLGARGAALRSELDKLVLEVVLPERANAVATGGDRQAALDALKAEWAAHKKRWE